MGRNLGGPMHHNEALARIFRCGVSSRNRERELTQFTIRIDGMHCGACVRRVTQALASAPGVTVEEVRIGAARLSTEKIPLPVQPALEALQKVGYTAHLES